MTWGRGSTRIAVIPEMIAPAAHPRAMMQSAERSGIFRYIPMKRKTPTIIQPVTKRAGSPARYVIEDRARSRARPSWMPRITDGGIHRAIDDIQGPVPRMRKRMPRMSPAATISPCPAPPAITTTVMTVIGSIGIGRRNRGR